MLQILGIVKARTLSSGASINAFMVPQQPAELTALDNLAGRPPAAALIGARDEGGTYPRLNLPLRRAAAPVVVHWESRENHAESR